MPKSITPEELKNAMTVLGIPFGEKLTDDQMCILFRHIENVRQNQLPIITISGRNIDEISEKVLQTRFGHLAPKAENNDAFFTTLKEYNPKPSVFLGIPHVLLILLSLLNLLGMIYLSLKSAY